MPHSMSTSIYSTPTVFLKGAFSLVSGSYDCFNLCRLQPSSLLLQPGNLLESEVLVGAGQPSFGCTIY